MKGEKIIDTIASTGLTMNHELIKAIQHELKKKMFKKNKKIVNIINVVNESPTIYSKSISPLLSKNKKLRNINTYINGMPNICSKTDKCFYGLRTTSQLAESLKYKKK